MTEEEQMIRTFYTRFQKLDWKGMLDCYHDAAFFYDPVFENLVDEQVRSMWEMLLTNAKDLKLDFSNIETQEGYGSCHWVATYTFSRTGRKVVNKGKAFFTFREGKITEHQDDFSFWNWSRQALGAPGLLFGGTSFFQKKVRKQARKSLDRFMASKATGAKINP